MVTGTKVGGCLQSLASVLSASIFKGFVIVWAREDKLGHTSPSQTN